MILREGFPGYQYSKLQTDSQFVNVFKYTQMLTLQWSRLYSTRMECEVFFCYRSYVSNNNFKLCQQAKNWTYENGLVSHMCLVLLIQDTINGPQDFPIGIIKGQDKMTNYLLSWDRKLSQIIYHQHNYP